MAVRRADVCGPGFSPRRRHSRRRSRARSRDSCHTSWRRPPGPMPLSFRELPANQNIQIRLCFRYGCICGPSPLHKLTGSLHGPRHRTIQGSEKPLVASVSRTVKKMETASRHFSRSLSCWLGAIVRLAPGAIFGRWLAGSPGGRRVAGAEGRLGGRAGPRRGIFDQSSAGDCSESRFRTGLVGHAAVAFSSAVGATLVQTLFAAGSWRRARARPCGR